MSRSNVGAQLVEFLSPENRRLIGFAILASVAASFIGRGAAQMFTASSAPTVVALTPPASIDYVDLDGRPGAISFGQNAPRLILVFSVDCVLCEKNMVNWKFLLKSIVEDPMVTDATQTIMLTTSDPSQTREYLARHGLTLPIGIIKRETLVDLGVRHYPTTLVPMSSDEVRAWVGILTYDAKREVLAAAEH